MNQLPKHHIDTSVIVEPENTEEGISFYTPKDTSKLLKEIKSADARIANADREILACASEDRAYALVTIDKELLNNKRLEALLGIKIMHPKDLL